MEKIKKFFKYYINNKWLRNLTALFMDFLIIFFTTYSLYYVYITDVKNINWYILLFSLIITIVLRRLSYRIRVVQVCPICKQNRGVSERASKTGNTKNFQQYVSGDYWCYSQDVEYVKITSCCYCSFYDETFYWVNESWQGDLTEEAKIRRESEARSRAIEHQRIAATQARIDAYERIRNRTRGY